MKKLYFVILSFISFIFISCGITYYLRYDFYLEDSKDKSLHFEDDKFAFDFTPFYNGIYFTITNKTDNSAILIWDKCFFIQPDGNSYQAINPDVLNEPTETIFKSKYESILPLRSKFRRFTTPSINIDKVTYTYVTQLITDFFGDRFSYNYVIPVKYNIAGDFFRYKVKESGKSSTTELKKISDYIKSNNNLSIGFEIKHNEKFLDYKFNFKVDKISAIYVEEPMEPSSPIKMILRKRYESDSKNSWSWKSMDTIINIISK
jgi:hypothetical protein